MSLGVGCEVIGFSRCWKEEGVIFRGVFFFFRRELVGFVDFSYFNVEWSGGVGGVFGGVFVF